MIHLFLLSAVSANPGAPDTLAPDRNWDLTHLDLRLDIDPDEGMVTGTATLNLSPMTPGSDTIWLHQESLNISAVRVDGQDVDFRLGRGDITIELDSHEAPVELSIDYSATPDKGLHFRAPGPNSPDTHPEVWSQGENNDNRYWFPTWDHPNDRFSYSGSFSVPDNYSVLSNGMGEVVDGRWNYQLEESLVSYLVMLAAGPYSIRTDEWRDQPVQQWYPADVDESWVEGTSGQVPEMLEAFSEWTGVDYPYPTYTEVFVQRFLYTGMENTTATVEERAMLQDPANGDTNRWAEGVVAHEAAHQWFGDYVTCETWNELWLNEGFATYFAGLWGQERWGDAWFARKVHGWQSRSYDAGPMAGRWWSTDEGDHRVNTHVYVKGASVIQMLRAHVGDEAFWAAINLYLVDNGHQNVTTEDLQEAFETVTGHHLGWFFDQWTHLSGSPKLAVNQQYSDGVLNVSVTPSGQEEPFPVWIEIEIGTADGPIYRRLFIEGERESVTVEMEEAPLWVAPSPNAGVLARIENNQSPTQWLAQTESPSPSAKLRAIEQLAEIGATDENLARLIDIAQDVHEELAYRLDAIEAIGELADEAGSETLVSLLKTDESSSVRESAADALAKGSSEGAVVPALTLASRRDSNAVVRASALIALRHHDRDAALRISRQVLRRSADYSATVHGAAVRVIGREGTTADVDRIINAVRPNQPSRLSHSAAWAGRGLVLRLEREQPDLDVVEQFARAVEPMLDSLSMRTRETGVSVLGSVGDDQSIRALREFMQHETIESLRERAQKAIDSIREGRDDEAPEESEVIDRINALEDRVEELQREITEASERH